MEQAFPPVQNDGLNGFDFLQVITWIVYIAVIVAVLAIILAGPIYFFRKSEDDWNARLAFKMLLYGLFVVGLIVLLLLLLNVEI